MSNVKNPATKTTAKSNCGCGCEVCSCGCPKDACHCEHNNCQCGCQTPVSSR